MKKWRPNKPNRQLTIEENRRRSRSRCRPEHRQRSPAYDEQGFQTRGTQIGGLKPIPRNPRIDPPPKHCFRCWQPITPGHIQPTCSPQGRLSCYNCGRDGRSLVTCERCDDAHSTFWGKNKQRVRRLAQSLSTLSKQGSSRLVRFNEAVTQRAGRYGNSSSWTIKAAPKRKWIDLQAKLRAIVLNYADYDTIIYLERNYCAVNLMCNKINKMYRCIRDIKYLFRGNAIRAKIQSGKWYLGRNTFREYISR